MPAYYLIPGLTDDRLSRMERLWYSSSTFAYDGIELIYPRREGRSPKQIGKKGLSNKRWIVGGKLGLLLNNLGLIVDWDVNTANVYDGGSFQHLVDDVAEEMLVFADHHFVKKEWNPPNLKICPKGTWNDRMLVESVLSMMTTVCHFKKVGHRIWEYFRSSVGYTMDLFNIFVQWHGFQPDSDGFAPPLN
ncbi:MAG: hypothetical protein GY762_05965 [Proteobacteria bacterium]|nr:hypothetical protein [Pseudomonadota bacterium]